MIVDDEMESPIHRVESQEPRMPTVARATSAITCPMPGLPIVLHGTRPDRRDVSADAARTVARG